MMGHETSLENRSPTHCRSKKSRQTLNPLQGTAHSHTLIRVFKSLTFSWSKKLVTRFMFTYWFSFFFKTLFSECLGAPSTPHCLPFMISPFDFSLPLSTQVCFNLSTSPTSYHFCSGGKGYSVHFFFPFTSFVPQSL